VGPAAPTSVMESAFPVVFLAVGVALLLVGAELFSEAAVDAARALRTTTLAIGLLLAGAEPEELFTAAIAAARDAPGIAIGDALGTNVTIIGLALGLGALVAPITVEAAALRHGLVALLVSLPASFMLARGELGRAEAVLLCALYAGYVWYVVRRERISLETGEGTLEELAGELAEAARRPAWMSLGLALLGLAMMASGGHFTVDGARGFAAWAGLAETAIGLTLVALATAAEMVVLSIVPVLKGHPELTLGGILGSYAYNLTLTLGVAALVSPLPASGDLVRLALAFMLGSLVLLLGLMRIGKLGRVSGLVLIVIYAVYLAAVLSA
jgi:cation:H+ antiporter